MQVDVNEVMQNTETLVCSWKSCKINGLLLAHLKWSLSSFRLSISDVEHMDTVSGLQFRCGMPVKKPDVRKQNKLYCRISHVGCWSMQSQIQALAKM